MNQEQISTDGSGPSQVQVLEVPLTATLAAYSNYHYHHHQAWRHLREAARHLGVSRSASVRENGVVPDWLLSFEPQLKRALEERPVLDQLSD